MSVNRITKKVQSSDGEHMLHVTVFIPDGEIKGLFQIVHGMQEYIGRYERFMTEIAQCGYIVFGHDHLGHGHSVKDDSELGFIAHENGWKRLTDDVGEVASHIRKEYGKNLPYILMGHSMGSFVARLAAQRFNEYDKLIIMGSGGPDPTSGIGIMIAKIIKSSKGEKHHSAFLGRLVFGSYNDRFEGETPHDWLSVNRENIKKFEADKLCTFPFTVSAMEDLIHLNHESNKAKWFSGIDKTKPVLLISGKDDPVGDYGKGISVVYDKLRKNGVDVTMKLYAGYRHEILNDWSYNAVVKDIEAFIN